ncbi:MAG: glycerol kinase GlpK [Proteobacteria bacterium]|nr:glycerol kinase GlpK [Pseudomonadota bacterium]
MTYLLALDQGTSSSRSIVFDARGRLVAMAQQELTQHFPQPGWVEHDALEIWRSQLATARAALAQAGIGAGEVAAIGITNQRETTVVWDRATGQPIHRAIVWQDRRTEPLCQQLREAGHGERVHQLTGLLIDAYFSATKLRWLLDHVPGARARAEAGELAFGTIDTWLLWQLTGGAVHATDVSNASRTMLLDVHQGRWSDELLTLLAIPPALLPEVRPSSCRFGTAQPAHFGAAVPIGGMAGDQQSALFGQACFDAGLVKNTYGTGCFMLMHTGRRFEASRNGLLTTATAQTDAAPQFALEGSVFVGGAVVQWLRDGLGVIQHSGDVQALAQSVPDSGGVMFVPAFTGLGAPYWQPDARGAILGLTRGSTAAHIARAAVESIAFQSAALLQAMDRDAVAGGGQPVRELRVDGGAAVNDALMQFQADLLGLPVLRPEVIETTAWGAACLAGLTAGVWAGTDELAALWRVQRRFEPGPAHAQAGEAMARWAHAVRQVVSR